MTADQQSIAQAIAAQLQLQPAPGYDSHWAAVFLLPGGGKLFISSGRQRGQLHISTSLPDGLRDHRPYYRAGEAPKTGINVSEAKSVALIVADIKRRLLPEHAREVAACAEQKAKRDAYHAQRTLALTEVARPFGQVVQADARTGEPRPVCVEHSGLFRLTAKPYCEGLELAIETNPAIAGQIASLLAKL